jgi:LysM repeat protein
MKKEDFKKKNPNDWMSERSKDNKKTPEPTKETEKAAVEDTESKNNVEDTEPSKEEEKKPGRPKVSNKKKQYTLTMNPDLYKTLSALAKENYKSFSQLVTDACIEYMKKL